MVIVEGGQPGVLGGESTMADRIALRKIGFGFLAITTSVMLMAALAVAGYVDGDTSPRFEARTSAASVAAISVR